VSLAACEESIQRRVVLYDKDGDYHFDTISAFIKSVRGSDPDAALYWLAKMVAAGEDPSFIFRRMIILASEDVGLADPRALQVVISCANSFDRIGFPEGNYPLAHACLYLATAPKSNSVMGFFDALSSIKDSTAASGAEVPNHLRDPSRDKDSFGHGEGYVYPHAYREHWTAQQYLPSVLQGKLFYMPSMIGYEGSIREETLKRRELQAAVILEEAARGGGAAGDAEALTWRLDGKDTQGWYRRLQSGRSRLLMADRDALFEAAKIKRHHRALIACAGDGLLLWESRRLTPEGLTCGLVRDTAEKDALCRYAELLEGGMRPSTDAAADIAADEPPFIAVSAGLPTPEEAKEWFDCSRFDCILAREPWRTPSWTPSHGGENGAPLFADFAAAARALLAEGGIVVTLQSPPALGQRLSAFLDADAGALREQLLEAEEAFFSSATSSASSTDRARWTWTALTLEAAFSGTGFSVTQTVLERTEARVISAGDIAGWFDAEKSPWGAFIHARLGETAFNAVRARITEKAKDGPLTWKWKTILLKCAG
jgi:putative ATPase